MEFKIQKFDKTNVRNGDVYAWTCNMGDMLVEVRRDEEYGLMIKPLRVDYWKPSYETIANDYLTAFDAILIYRKGRIA